MKDQKYAQLDKFLKENSPQAPKDSPFESSKILYRVKNIESKKSFKNYFSKYLSYFTPMICSIFLLFWFHLPDQSSSLLIEDYLEEFYLHYEITETESDYEYSSWELLASSII